MSTSTREEILSYLQGQRVRIPNLQALYGDWPSLINPEQDAITSVVQYVLETHSMTKKVEMKLKRANLSLLIASWYSFATAEALKSITYFVCWLYVVDDAIIDRVSWPGLDNATAFDVAYRDLMDFVARSLKLEGNMNDPQPQSPVAAIDSFRGIGQVLCEKYTLAQRQKFYDSCRLTMEGYRTEQQLRVAGKLPTLDDYWTYREGSSGISMCVAMIELAIGSNIPIEILESPEIQDLWTETTVATWVTNDIVSAKKEISEGFIENAVALCAIETRSAQGGMDKTVQLLKDSIARFEEKARLVEAKFLWLSRTEI